MTTMAPGAASGLLIALSLGALFVVLALGVRWARRRSRGALLTGALFSVFAPDPEFERRLRLAEEAQQEQHEEEGSGADR